VREQVANMSMRMTVNKRANFPNMKEAAEFLRRKPCKAWDERVFQRYLKHGFKTKNTPEGPVITVKTDPHQEGLTYPDLPPFIEAGALLTDYCTAGVIPFHAIFGANNDYVPRDLQDHLVDASKGRNFVSVTRVAGAGHLVVQEQPDGLANAICDKLNAKGLSKPVHPKL